MDIKTHEEFLSVLQSGDTGKLKDLLSCDKTLINQRDDKFFNTPLHRAVFTKTNQLAVIELLINYGADCNALNKKLLTPSELALSFQLTDVAEHMINLEIKPLDTDKAYYLIIRRGNKALFEMLRKLKMPKKAQYEKEIEIIEKTYFELRVKNVAIKMEMQDYLEHTLIEYDWTTKCSLNLKDKSFISGLAEKIIENVELLEKYNTPSVVEIDDEFLLRSTYILENVHFLKNQCKDLPLHHLELCLGFLIQIWRNTEEYCYYRLLIDKNLLLMYLNAIKKELKKMYFPQDVKWTSKLDEEVMFSYYVAAKLENVEESLGDFWAKRQPKYSFLSARNLINRKKMIIGKKLIEKEKMEALKVEAEIFEGVKKIRWNEDLNKELLFAYFVATEGGSEVCNYKKKMLDVWREKNQIYSFLTESNLVTQKKRIEKENLISQAEIDKIKQKVGNYRMEDVKKIKISGKSKRIFKKMKVTFTQLNELHSVKRTIKYLDVLVDVNFDECNKNHVLAIKRVIQVLGESIKSTENTPSISRKLQNTLKIIAPRFFMNTSKIRDRLLHSSQIIEEKAIFCEVHDNLKIIRNFFEFVESMKQNQLIKQFMNRAIRSRSLEEIKSFFPYVYMFLERLERRVSDYAPSVLIEIKSLFDIIRKICPNHEKIENGHNCIEEELKRYKILNEVSYHSSCPLSLMVHMLKSHNNLGKMEEFIKTNFIGYKFTKNLKLIDLTFFNRISTILAEINVQNIDPKFNACLFQIKNIINNHGIQFTALSELQSIMGDEDILGPIHLEDRFAEIRYNGIKSRGDGNKLSKIDEIAMEMLLLETITQMNLPNNAETLNNMVPFITGRNLRDYLAHGNITYIVLAPNFTRKTLLINSIQIANSEYTEYFQGLKKNKYLLEIKLDFLKRQTTIFENFKSQSFEDVEQTFDHEKYFVGRNFENSGILDHILQAKCNSFLQIIQNFNTESRGHPFIKSLCYFQEDTVHLPKSKLYEVLDKNEYRMTLYLNLAVNYTEDDSFLFSGINFPPELYDALILLHEKIFLNYLKRNQNVGKTTIGRMLHSAVIVGNLEMLKLLIARTSNLNQLDENNVTALHLACKLNQLDMIKALIEAGADWYAEDKNKCPAISFIFTTNDCETIEYLKQENVLRKSDKKLCLNPFILFCDDNNDAINDYMLQGADFSKLYGPVCQMNKSKLLEYILVNDKKLKHNIDKPWEMGMTVLQMACMQGFPKIVELLLKYGANPNEKGSILITSLHIAIQNKNYDMTKMLLERGAHVSTLDANNLNALEYGIAFDQPKLFNLVLKYSSKIKKVYVCPHIKNVEVLKKLKEAGIKFKMNEKLHNETPLHMATDCDKIDLLLEHFDINCQTTSKWTPLHSACYEGRRLVVEQLLDRGADPNIRNSDEHTPLALAVLKRDLKLVKILLKCSIDEDSKGQALLMSLMKCRLDITDELLANNVNIQIIQNATFHSTTLKQHSCNLLHYAARFGHNKIIKFLLDKKFVKVDVLDSLKYTALLTTATNHKLFDSSKLLLKYGARVDKFTKSGKSILYLAAEANNAELLKYLFNYYPEIKKNFIETDEYGNSPLHIAVLTNSNQAVECLVKELKSSNPLGIALPNHRNFTPIHASVQTNNKFIFKILFNNAPKIEIPDINGQTILHSAVAHANTYAVKKLMTRKEINLHAQCKGRQNILHYAVFSKNISMVKRVLQVKDLKLVKDSYGKTPLQYAAEIGLDDIYKVIKNAFR